MMCFHVRRDLAQGAEDLTGFDGAYAFGAAIVEKAGETDAEKRRDPDPFGELAAKLAFSGNDGDSLHALRREQTQQNHRHQRPCGEQRDRSCEHPSEDDARVKGAECARRPTDKQQECNDDKPA